MTIKMIGQSTEFMNLLFVAEKVAQSQANVFITGESGTGKEMVAQYIHDKSTQSKGPFIAINCSAIPENLLESELFGHAKGSFTGAIDKKIGLFEEAENGTLFLDEIGDLSLPLQAKLLRVLQEKKIKRVGENQFRNINARIISATHKNLAKEIELGTFREDLFYRLSVVPIEIPALRNRKEDILPLAEFFLKEYALKNRSQVKSFSPDALNYLMDNAWYGNVRELENAIERAVILATTDQVEKSDFAPSIIEINKQNIEEATQEHFEHEFTIGFQDHLPTLDATIQKYIEFAVSHNHGAKDRTAREIGIDRKTLYKRLRPTNENEPSH